MIFFHKNKQSEQSIQMSSNTEILGRVLELCEKHMTEGEYLISSKLLKTVSEQNPDNSSLIKTVRFVRPIRIKIGDSLAVFVVGYIAYRNTIHCGFILKKVLFKILDNEIPITYGSSFSDILKTIIKSEMAYTVEIFDFFGIPGNSEEFLIIPTNS